MKMWEKPDCEDKYHLPFKKFLNIKKNLTMNPKKKKFKKIKWVFKKQWVEV